ncbi:helix-turn-helix domain-containing protein [Pseudonocardia kujensis]|uniref:helix-turn-helix domain-containing protein n=1 Tax=Pseudonocardia kujensis TaxID=1128675 RepID=UPI001E658DEF|nr:helix-turn-helix domain-containing protein [Pseudonocardia kujensis]MCE0767426.1 helix-turn-helix domain-containing protein [Pseudonocardia kujensis]
MTLAFHLREVPVEGRLDAWRRAASRLIHPMIVRAEAAPERGSVIRRLDAGLHTIRVSGVRSTVERPAALIRPDDPAFVQLTVVLSGGLVAEQDGEGGQAGAGDLLWYSSTRPYRLTATDEFELVHFLVPQRCTALVREHLCPTPATPLARHTPAWQLLVPFLRGIADWRAGDQQTYRDGALESALVHLVGSLPRRMSGSVARVGADPFDAATDYIGAHLGAPDLTPAQVAGALNVSVRHLHATFSRRGLSVAAYIRNERLEHAARDLVDPACAHVAVAEIAQRWGFSSAAHFSRVFAKRFGRPPTALRRVTASRAPGESSPQTPLRRALPSPP